jgi:hypothetical protein
MDINYRSLLIYTAAGWSGFFVMGVELLGGRLLAPYFGNSIFVWGGIIAVFMTCLSIGYLVGGQLSMRTPSLARLGQMLMGGASLAIPIIAIGDEILEYLSYFVPDPRYGSLLGSLMLFGAPTIMSGMISPYAVRLLISDLQKSGRSAGLLYFVSTFGSAAGTILISFYFVLYLEVNVIILSLISVSGVVGAMLFITDFAYRRKANICAYKTC